MKHKYYRELGRNERKETTDRVFRFGTGTAHVVEHWFRPVTAAELADSASKAAGQDRAKQITKHYDEHGEVPAGIFPQSEQLEALHFVCRLFSQPQPPSRVEINAAYERCKTAIANATLPPSQP